MDPKDMIQIGVLAWGTLAPVAVAKYMVGKHETLIEGHAKWLATLEVTTQLLKQKQDSHSDQIDQIMRDLKEAIKDLQNIALQLAGRPVRN